MGLTTVQRSSAACDVNDIGNVLLSKTVKVFADDTKFFYI